MPPCPTIFSLATTWIGIDEETHVTTVTSPHWYIHWSREYCNQELWVIISLKLWTDTHWSPPLLGSHLCGTPKRPVQPYHVFDPPGALCSLREWTGTLMGTWGLTVNIYQSDLWELRINQTLFNALTGLNWSWSMYQNPHRLHR
jgi:hypothetical protein